MTVALQIRDVPEDVRDVLSRRAAEMGQSLQKYLLDLVIREAGQQHNVELIRRVRPSGASDMGQAIVAALSAAREERTRRIEDAIE